LLLFCHVNSIGRSSAAGQLATGWSPVFLISRRSSEPYPPPRRYIRPPQ
jgi:hypothetical protein